MGRREPQEEALDHLGSEAKSVLAVVVMAALWPGRFSGGWVSVGDFAKAGVLLGERANQESLKAAIRRGLRRLAQVPGPPPIESRRTLEQDPLRGRVRRDRDRRLTEPPEPVLDAWFLRNGPELIAPDVWRHFFPVGPNATTGCAVAREVLRRSLLQAESSLRFAALVVRPRSPEALALRRIRRALAAGIRAVDASNRPSQAR